MSSARLDYVPPDSIDRVWHLVGPWIERVRRRNKERDWTEQDVKEAIADHSAQLFLAVIDNYAKGFVLLKKLDRVMWIWASYSANGGAFVPLLDQAARAAGCDRLSFSSTRAGWRRNRMGFTPVATIYERSL